LGSSLKATRLGEGQAVAREGFEAATFRESVLTPVKNRIAYSDAAGRVFIVSAKSAIENSFTFGFSIICFYNSSEKNAC